MSAEHSLRMAHVQACNLQVLVFRKRGWDCFGVADEGPILRGYVEPVPFNSRYPNDAVTQNKVLPLPRTFAPVTKRAMEDVERELEAPTDPQKSSKRQAIN